MADIRPLSQNVLVILAALTVVANAEYVNAPGEPFSFNCRNRRFIKHISSDYFAKPSFDRRWEFTCAKIPGFDKGEPDSNDIGCNWIPDYVNDWRWVINFNCSDEGYINGIESFFNKAEGDRRYRFRCCFVRSYVMENCQLEWANTWTTPIDFEVPEGYVLTGVSSYYQRKTRDRLFGFWFCQMKNNINQVLLG